MFDAARHKRAMKAYKQYGGKEYVLKTSPHDPKSIEDISLLAGQGESLAMIIQTGRIHRQTFNTGD
mgnify:CR=1 FL=1